MSDKWPANDPWLDRAALRKWLAQETSVAFARRTELNGFYDRGGQVQIGIAVQPTEDDSPTCHVFLGYSGSQPCECFDCAGWPEPEVIALVRAPTLEEAKQAAIEAAKSEGALTWLQGTDRWQFKRRART